MDQPWTFLPLPDSFENEFNKTHVPLRVFIRFVPYRLWDQPDDGLQPPGERQATKAKAPNRKRKQ